MKIPSSAIEWRGIDAIYSCQHWDEQAVSEWIDFVEQKICGKALQNGLRQRQLSTEAARKYAQRECAAFRRALGSRISGNQLCNLNDRMLKQMNISESSRMVILSELTNVLDNTQGLKLIIKIDTLLKGLDKDLLRWLREAQQRSADWEHTTVLPTIPTELVQIKQLLHEKDHSLADDAKFYDTDITQVQIILDLRQITHTTDIYEYPATVPIDFTEYAIEAVPSIFSSHGTLGGINIQISFT